MYVSGYALGGKRTSAEMTHILQQVVALIAMDTGGMEPKIWYYPLEDGISGGQGETIIQPLVESFIVSDSWAEIDKTYVILASCRPYDPRTVAGYLVKEIGPLLRSGYFEL